MGGGSEDPRIRAVPPLGRDVPGLRWGHGGRGRWGAPRPLTLPALLLRPCRRKAAMKTVAEQIKNGMKTGNSKRFKKGSALLERGVAKTLIHRQNSDWCRLVQMEGADGDE